MNEEHGAEDRVLDKEVGVPELAMELPIRSEPPEASPEGRQGCRHKSGAQREPRNGCREVRNAERQYEQQVQDRGPGPGLRQHVHDAGPQALTLFT
jgi:hypothetical protein